MINITNSDIADITVGDIPVEKAYLGTNLVWENYNGPDLIDAEYIENTSNAFIDTGFKNGAAAWSIDAVISFNTIKQGYIIGSRGSSSTRYFQMLRLNSQGHLYTMVNQTNAMNSEYTIELGKKYHFVGSIKSMNVYYEDIDEETQETVTKSFTLTNSGSYVSNGYTINIFNWVGQDHVNHRIQGKIYSVKLYNSSNTLIRDYVPKYQYSTKKYGLYDIVNDTLNFSPNGTAFNGKR